MPWTDAVAGIRMDLELHTSSGMSFFLQNLKICSLERAGLLQEMWRFSSRTPTLVIHSFIHECMRSTCISWVSIYGDKCQHKENPYFPSNSHVQIILNLKECSYFSFLWELLPKSCCHRHTKLRIFSQTKCQTLWTL